MKIRLDFGCPNDHVTEKIVKSGTTKIKCPKCGKRAGIVWMNHKQHMWDKPIVFWKYSDGQIGFAGSSEARTPRNAERVEVRSRMEYDRVMRVVDQQARTRGQRGRDMAQEKYERDIRERRRQLSWMMANESDPIARDIYREALEGGNKGAYESSQPRGRIYNEAMENNRSNWERD